MLVKNINVEFKESYTGNIAKSVIAFANTDGGKIILGISDDGSIVGIDDLDETMLKISNKIRDTIKPDATLFTNIYHESRDGKTILIIEVQRGTERPYYLSDKGIRPAGVFVRQASSSVPASEAAILKMIKDSSNDCYEEAKSLEQDLTLHATELYFKKHNLALKPNQQRSLGLIANDGSYTNLALLLSDQCTHNIRLAVFEGSQKTVFKDRKELSGSLLKQLEDAYAFIDRHNRTRSEFFELERVDLRDYPQEAVRETLLNAIIHREYSINASTLVSIFDDRIEFISVGGLLNGITIQDISLGVSVLRNKNLANIFYRLKLIEAYGTGLAKIRAAYASSSLNPHIETSTNAFKITLPNLNYLREQDVTTRSKKPIVTTYPSVQEQREKAILELFESQDQISRIDVQNTLDVSQSTSILLLRDMTEEGTLYKVGKGKQTRYRKGVK